MWQLYHRRRRRRWYVFFVPLLAVVVDGFGRHCALILLSRFLSLSDSLLFPYYGYAVAERMEVSSVRASCHPSIDAAAAVDLVVVVFSSLLLCCLR